MKKVILLFTILLSLQDFESFAASVGFEYCFSPADTVKIELIFGLKKPDHKVVSRKQWKLFMEEVITPRFPNGFTVTDANGHWKGLNEIVKEPSKIFSVVCIMDHETETKIEDIINLYKKKFQQEAVLRIDAKVSYWLK